MKLSSWYWNWKRYLNQTCTLELDVLINCFSIWNCEYNSCHMIPSHCSLSVHHIFAMFMQYLCWKVLTWYEICRLGIFSWCCRLLFLKPWVQVSTSRRVCSVDSERAKTYLYWIWKHGMLSYTIYFSFIYFLLPNSCHNFIQ